MEAIAAFGVATGIVQLVSFTSDVARETYQMIRNAKSMPSNFSTLQDLEKTSKSLCERLLASLSRPLPEDETLLMKVVNELGESLADLDATFEKVTTVDQRR